MPSWTTSDHAISNRTATKRHDFEPFGYEVAPSGTWRTSVTGYGVDTVRQKFTGQERDNESSLDFFNARYFDGIQGRFTSPDPDMAGANLRDPQSWNAYAYVSNNPLSYTDPSGTALCATCIGAETGNPIAIGIGAAIDLFGALFGLFGGGGGPPADLGPVADAMQPITLQPSPDVDWQQGPGGTMADDGSDLSGDWNERVPMGGTPGMLNIGGVFGGGSMGPFVFSALDPNTIEQHHLFSQALRAWFASRNIDIDKFLISLPAGLHRLKSFGGLHTGVDNWNAQWMRYYNAARNTATREEMFDFAKQLVKKFKIGGFPGGSTFESVPIIFFDTCNLDPDQPVCLSRRSPGPMF